jgi:Fic family protein
MAIADAVRSLLITPEVLSLIAEIDEFKGAWRALNTLAPERLAVLRKVATIESIGSSTRIEGARLSDREVEALLSRLETHSFHSRDEEEVAGYAEAMERIFLSYSSIPLTENYIQQLHSILLRYSSKDEHHRGRYKTLSNNVEAFGPNGESLGIVFETATPFETPLRMHDLVSWTQATLADGRLHPLLVTAVFTVYFLAVHPFQDGNGRLSRILTTLLLLKAGYAYVPFSSLESVIEQNKEGYYLALRRTQTSLKAEKPDWEPWVLFLLRSLQRQKLRLAEKVDQSRLMLGNLSALEEKIVELARSQGRIRVGEIILATGANRSTIKLRLASLVRGGTLAKHGRGRSTWYSLML